MGRALDVLAWIVLIAVAILVSVSIGLGVKELVLYLMDAPAFWKFLGFSIGVCLLAVALTWAIGRISDRSSTTYPDKMM